MNLKRHRQKKTYYRDTYNIVCLLLLKLVFIVFFFIISFMGFFFFLIRNLSQQGAGDTDWLTPSYGDSQ